MKFVRLTGLSVLLIITLFTARAQENIPIGTWRTHFSYNQVNHVIEAGDLIYAASEKGLFIFDKQDNSITKLSKIDGLQESNISTIQYDEESEIVFIGYASGNLDLIDGQEIINLDLTTTSQIQGSKKINHFTIYQDYAYISTDFGVLKFDIQKQEVKETYRELGLGLDDTPQALQVNMSSVLNDSLFIASEEGVLAANLVEGYNLLDYRNWHRFAVADGIPDDPVSVIASKQNEVLAGLDNQGLFVYNNGDWNNTGSLTDVSFASLFISDLSLVVADSIVYILDEDFNPSQLVVDAFAEAKFMSAIVSSDEKVWLGSLDNGLLSDFGGAYQSYLPSGPSGNEVFRLKYSQSKIYGVAGGFSDNVTPYNNAGEFFVFSDGSWESTVFEKGQFNDIVDVATFNNKTYYASAGYGLLEIDQNGEQVIYDETNSPLINISPPERNVRVPAIKSSSVGLWVLNYGVGLIHLLGTDGTWQSFSIGSGFAAFAVDMLLVDDDIWLIIDQSNGGGIVAFDPETQSSRYLSSTSGSGGLASTDVNSLALDKDGLVWAGSDIGVSVFSNPFSVYSGLVDAIEPIFENRQLLRDEVVTDIEVDGGNRKWMGTENGVWLFDEQADTQIRFFNDENSPLPSDEISDVEINDITGEVFFATPEGLVSWRGSGTEGQSTHTDVKIFPNPVRESFKGTVGISGLATNANVKITDVSGKLIWQSKANGGTATWQVKDYNGGRASTGVYLVFSSTEDGEESFVGKIAVIK